MALATLSIDLVAKLSKLEQDLGKAVRMSEQRSAQISSAFNSIKSAAGGVAGALAGAFTGFSIADFIKSNADAIDALNDVSDATGASIENISSLEQTALRTGTTLDTVSQALVKMNQVLREAKPGSEVERALSAIHLSAQQLRQQDPSEALRTVAAALSTYADDGNKARLVQELLGKSMREIAPFLKDLAEKGRLAAKMTAEQAAEAERFNQQLAQLKTNSVNTGRSLTIDLIERLNKTAEAFRAGAEAGDGFLTTLRKQQLQLLGFNVDNARDYTEQIAAVEKVLQRSDLATERRVRLENQLGILRTQQRAQQARDALKLGEGIPQDPHFREQRSIAFEPRDEKAIAVAEKAARVQAELTVAINERVAAAQLELQTGAQVTDSQKFALEIVGKLADAENHLSAAQKAALTQQLQGGLATLQLNEQTRESLRLKAEAQHQAERELQAMLQAAQARDADLQSLRESVAEIGLSAAAIDQLRMARLEDALATEEWADAARRADENVTAAAIYGGEQRIRQLREEISLRRQGLAKQQAIDTSPIQGASRAVQDYLDTVEKAGVATRDAVGRSLSALEDSLTDFFVTGKLGTKQLVNTMLAEFYRLQVIRPLMQSLFSDNGSGGGGGGGLFGQLFGAFLGSFGGGGSAPAGRAYGGPVEAGGLYRINERGTPEVLSVGGQDYLMTGARGGRVTAPKGAGNVVNISYTIAPGVTRTELASYLEMTKRTTKAEILQSMRNNGAFARTTP